jgi:nucleolar protein 9
VRLGYYTRFFSDCSECNPLQELLPTFRSLILDPFASHVLRALLLLLSPCSVLPSSQSQSIIRSKKSAVFKARQGPMKSVFAQENKEPTSRSTPDEFKHTVGRFVKVLRDELSGNEVRALAVDKVASPVLQVRIALGGNFCHLLRNTNYRCYWR